MAGGSDANTYKYAIGTEAIQFAIGTEAIQFCASSCANERLKVLWNLAKAVLSWPGDILRTRDLRGSWMSTRARMCGSTLEFHVDRNALKETQDDQLQEGARGLQMAQRPAYKPR